MKLQWKPFYETLLLNKIIMKFDSYLDFANLTIIAVIIMN